MSEAQLKLLMTILCCKRFTYTVKQRVNNDIHVQISNSNVTALQSWWYDLNVL